MLEKPEELVQFGLNIRRLREQSSLSQEELAARCQLHRTYVGAIERGERNIGLQNVVRLAHALGQKPQSLLKGIT